MLDVHDWYFDVIVGKIQVSVYSSKYSIIRSYDVNVKCEGVSTCKSTYYLVDLYSACPVLCQIICVLSGVGVVSSIHWLHKPMDGIPG